MKRRSVCLTDAVVLVFQLLECIFVWLVLPSRVCTAPCSELEPFALST